MSAYATPRFWASPLRYIRWASRERPAYFWSVVIGTIGPIEIFAVPPIRRMFNDADPSTIPVTYPVPEGPRKKLTGYDDE